MANRKEIHIDENPKRVRVVFGGETIADSTGVLTLHERGHLPVYYFPEKDVRMDLLVQTDRQSFCPLKGDASYWTVKVGDRISENAAWSYPNPLPLSERIRGYIAFYWNRVDSWYEEEEEVFVHPRDPYKRVDAIRSSRHVEIFLKGIKLADSCAPVIVFETGVPVRYYLPKADVRTEYLSKSEHRTACPYKGTASYWNVNLGGEVYENLVWSYLQPIPEILKIQGLYSFYNEKVEVYVDGHREEQPKWHLSALDFFNATEVRAQL
jgi:uncharacterized protein (DUF427 family)